MAVKNDAKYRKKFQELARTYNEMYPMEKIEDESLKVLHKILTDPRMFRKVCRCKRQPLNLEIKKPTGIAGKEE